MVARSKFWSFLAGASYLRCPYLQWHLLKKECLHGPCGQVLIHVEPLYALCYLSEIVALASQAVAYDVHDARM